jgi:hypothetical protein
MRCAVCDERGTQAPTATLSRRRADQKTKWNMFREGARQRWQWIARESDAKTKIVNERAYGKQLTVRCLNGGTREVAGVEIMVHEWFPYAADTNPARPAVVFSLSTTPPVSCHSNFQSAKSLSHALLCASWCVDVFAR